MLTVLVNKATEDIDGSVSIWGETVHISSGKPAIYQRAGANNVLLSIWLIVDSKEARDNQLIVMPEYTCGRA